VHSRRFRTRFSVLVNGRPAGTIAMACGTGDLELDNDHTSLPPALAPVWDIMRVGVVDDAGCVVLRGSFGDARAKDDDALE
jgi:hypothetical protein